MPESRRLVGPGRYLTGKRLDTLTTLQATPVCEELTAGLEHDVLRVMTSSMNARGVVKMELQDVAQLLEVDYRDVVFASETLVDFGYLSKEQGIFSVIAKCFHPHPKGFFVPTQKSRLRGVLTGEYDTSSEGGGVGLDPRFGEVGSRREPSDHVTSSVNSNSYRSNGKKISSGKTLTTMYLAQFYFPGQCRKRGISVEGHNAAGLCKTFNRWYREDGMELEKIAELINLFAVNGKPWCRGKTPWMVMASRISKLLLLLEERATQVEQEAHRYDPDYWLTGGEKKRAVSESEAHRYDRGYWLTGRTTVV